MSEAEPVHRNYNSTDVAYQQQVTPVGASNPNETQTQLPTGLEDVPPNGPPPSYREVPGTVSLQVGGLRGPPPTYEEAINPNAPPPTYDSLFGRVREVHRSSNGVVEFVKNLLILLLGTIGCTVILGVTIIIPLCMIAIGAAYFNECPAEPYIPIYLVVGGSFGVLKQLLHLLSRIRHRNEEPEEQLRQSPVQTLINCFMFGWFVTGSFWIYRIYEPDLVDSFSLAYCEKTLYVFSFWLVTCVYLFLGLLGFCLCCVSVTSVVVQGDL